ncbi:MAG TPA: hypothetical protein VNO21_02765, partial [Polyangiaceae bacterium]|nr:hypothetical protein [Polyangiaceae bacterium]
ITTAQGGLGGAWPSVSSPQQVAVPSCRIPQVKFVPAETCKNAPLGGVAAFLPLLPQQATCPSWATAHACLSPDETCWKVPAGVVVMPSPE